MLSTRGSFGLLCQEINYTQFSITDFEFMLKVEHTLSNIAALLQDTRRLNLVCQPAFYRISDDEERTKVRELLQRPGIKVSDELHGQLRELVKSKNPTCKFKPEELNEAARNYIGDVPSEEYGVWVYYPWLNHLVHILDKEDYRDVRTNRNQYKITPEERDILSNVKIGVLGLSVGQSVAIALSMERSFGELRIADFDMLELSNLNRIRSGIQDLGLLKTVSTARQIAEIDPYLNVVCFHEGINESNLDAFFTEGGKLDIVIDECDGLDIKILARLKAKELRVPMLMETSDRGMLDVERFDLEQNRSIMHGLIDHLDLNPNNLKGLSNEEKIPYILPMLGLDTMSDRLKASMLEVEQSITTWPQLASDVILGGAVSANVCRRIALKQFQASGRFFVDMNEIVSERNVYRFKTEEEIVAEPTSLYESREKLNVHQLAADTHQLELEKVQVNALVKAAITAPSGGNSQPWRWVYKKKNLYLLLDKSRASAFLDYESAGGYLALGAATENLILKAHNMGLEVSVEQFPDKENPEVAAVFRFYLLPSSTNRSVESHAYDNLADAISIRLTNRLLRNRVKLPIERLAKLQELGQSVSGAEVSWIDDENAMKSIGELIAKNDRILITHKEGHHGFVTEIRWNEEEVNTLRDGVDIATIDLSAGEAAGFRMAKNWSVVKMLNNWGGGSVFEKLSRKCVAGASAIGLITMSGSASAQYYDAGRAMEKIWLQANKEGISLQPMTALTFMLHRLIHGKGVGLTPANVEELKMIKKEFYEIFNLSGNRHPAFLFRVLVAGEPKVKSLRRPVEDVLIFNK